MSAPDYVDSLMSWVQAQLDDEKVFPCKIGAWRALARRLRNITADTSRCCSLQVSRSLKTFRPP